LLLGSAQASLTSAAAFLYMMPMIIPCAAQENIIRGVVTTGLKG
jgi:hypothetical protein